MKTLEDAHNRIDELEKTMQWEVRGHKNKLVSTKSGRVFADITQDGDEFVASIGRSYRSDGERFTNLDAAKIWTKFTVIKDKLSDEFREATIQ